MVTEVDTTQPNYDAPPPGPAWLRSLLGDDFAQTVYSLSLESCNDDDLALIATLPKMKRLRLGGERRFTSQGLSHVGKMKSLESLNLTGLIINDDVFQHLQSLDNLKELTLSVNAMPEYVERLKKALPLCKIQAKAPVQTGQ